jgi:predicted nucleotide-binding protein (sugar kinase/HSP70/actin superfamily)
MITVGIPRGLYFYKYYTLWETFFKTLGAEVVLSDHTNKKILTDGANNCVSEACLPIKVYFGHVINLVGKTDYIFMPRFTSISKKQYICPEICGVPDMVKSSIKNMQRIIDPEINLRESVKNSWLAAAYTGEFITKDRNEIRQAYKDAVRVYQCERQVIKSGVLPNEIQQENKLLRLSQKESTNLTVAIIGHSYTVYDSFLNMELIKKLKSYGAKVVTLDMLDYRASKEKCSELQKKIFWDYGTRAYGGAIQLIESGEIDGILALTSFGCGVDSLVDELVEKKIRQESNIPFMKLVLDEHSAEAGFLTRIEAFVDMIIRRRKNETDISTLGEHLYSCESTVG